jgi:hypothetical protein
MSPFTTFVLLYLFLAHITYYLLYLQMLDVIGI